MIATLTDFGHSEYLGVMKGVIYSVNKNAQIADLYNNVCSQNVKEAAWLLYKNYKYFPKNTIFLCVVDPGVGSKRQCLAIKTKNYFFVGPDNGLMHKASREDGIVAAVRLPVKNASMTFHGRDIFAEAAAKLESGARINKLGIRTNIKAKLDFYLKGREGEVMRIDNFGNIVTNLRSLNKREYTVKTKSFNQKMGFYETYEASPDGCIFLIRGSSDTLELSARNSDASKKAGLKIGDRIKIE